MRLIFKPLDQQIVVVTGASSGIGLATARMAAARGARLVLVSRNERVLRDIVNQVTAAGHEAVHVAADVGKRADIERIADTAIERFGGFDTWVNNAGHSIYGRLEEIGDDDHHRLFQTNFWGTVYGSLTAVEHLKRRGGTIINLGSIASDNAIPMQGMYAASKHAIKGFTDALRMELEADGAPISLTLIKPTAIDTPFPQHARNYMDREPKLPSPVYAPEEVAHAILYAATHAKRDIYVGGSSKAMSVIGRVAPGTINRLTSRMMPSRQKRDEAPRDPEGTLYRPGDDGRVHGDHPGRVLRRSLYTRSSIHPVLTSALVAAAGLAVGAVWYRSSPRRLRSRRARSLHASPEASPDLSAAQSLGIPS